jgi:hypothetical protein
VPPQGLRSPKLLANDAVANDGPMPGYVTINTFVEIEPNAFTIWHTADCDEVCA